MKKHLSTIVLVAVFLAGVCLLVHGIMHSHRAPKQQNTANYSDTSTWAQPPLHNQTQQEAPTPTANASASPAAETVSAPDAAAAQESAYAAPDESAVKTADSTDESQIKED